jgi:hypothetical protein
MANLALRNDTTELQVTMETGHHVEVVPSPGRRPQRLVVRGPDGEVQLSMRFTPDGPVLTFAAVEIEVDTVGALRVECARFDVQAEEGINLETQGNLLQRAGGDAGVVAGGRIEAVAHEVAIAAHAGRVTIDADDDVDVHGGRILLNS